MVEDFMNKYGTYPLEIKLAIKEYIIYSIKNKHLFSQVPMSSKVGNTSVQYSLYLEKNFNKGFLRSCPEVREILSTTNVLNPYGFSKRMSFIGTPFNIEPYKSDTTVTKNNNSINSPTSNFTSMETILSNLPKCSADVLKKKYKMNGAIRTDIVDYDYCGEVIGNLKLHEFDDKIRATLYIPNNYIDGSKVDIVLEDKVKVYTDNKEYVYTVLGITKASDENETHHYELDMS
jgi:hypothetical protein